MVAVLVPHFDLPFRFSSGSVAVVEQDTSDDVANCVEAILRTSYGFRTQDNTPDFGINDPLFENIPVNIESIKSTILSQEPRAEIVITEDMDRLDNMIENITVGIS
jgi:hypothetical protein